MATYRVDLYAPGDRLTGVRVVTADKGTDAADAARKAVWTTSSDHADVYAYQDGDDRYYTTVTRAAR